MAVEPIPGRTAPPPRCAWAAYLLRDAIQPITLADDTPVSVGLSVGISIISSVDRKTQSVLDSADATRYRAKARPGRRCVVAGAPDLDEKSGRPATPPRRPEVSRLKPKALFIFLGSRKVIR